MLKKLYTKIFNFFRETLTFWRNLLFIEALRYLIIILSRLNIKEKKSKKEKCLFD